MRIEEKVILPGYDPQPQHYIALMDLFLLSSFSEGTSMTLLEAMALGKPCVVTDVGGNPEVIINNENGLVAKTDDANAFSQAISELITERQTSEKMSAYAKARYTSTFSDSAMNAKFSKIYNNLSNLND